MILSSYLILNRCPLLNICILHFFLEHVTEDTCFIDHIFGSTSSMRQFTMIEVDRQIYFCQYFRKIISRVQIICCISTKEGQRYEIIIKGQGQARWQSESSLEFTIVIEFEIIVYILFWNSAYIDF